MNWQPIDTAPKDGTVILTDEGICIWRNRSSYFVNPTGDWCHCDSYGAAFICADDGPFWAAPKVWIPLPKYS